MGLQISCFYAGVFALLFLYLSIDVSKRRTKYQVGLGDGGNMDLLKAIRIHGNFAEYVPLALLMIFLCDYVGTRPWILHILGILLIIGRILHIVALRKSEGFTTQRILGTILTWFVILATSIICLITAI